MNKDYIYRRRLLSLVKLLEKLPEDRFDYANWVGNDWKGKADLSCGTSACALGFATTIPALRKAGLRLTLNVDYRSNGMNGGLFVVCLKGKEDTASFNSSFIAGRKVFGINNEEFEWLFVPGTYSPVLHRYNLSCDASAKQVAGHIREFVEKKIPGKEEIMKRSHPPSLNTLVRNTLKECGEIKGKNIAAAVSGGSEVFVT